MQLHELQPIHKPKKGRRVGRGRTRGAFSGRGMKGQKARAGRKFKPIIRELIKKYPKIRGYKFRSKSQRLKSRMAIFNLGDIENKFNAGEKVSPEILLEKKLIRRINGETPKVKILGKGEIKKALTVEGCLVSKSVKEKIEKAGGSIK